MRFLPHFGGKNMNRITAVVFSPTGGTLRAAQMLCGLWDAPVRWLRAEDRTNTVSLDENDFLVAAFPVYAGQIPALEGLFENMSGRGTPCVVLAAYGNRHYDDALAQMKARLERRGFRCIGAAACITPHTFAPELGAGRPDEADRAVLAEFAADVEKKLCGDRACAEVPGNPDPAPKQPVPVEKTVDRELCRACNTCVRACPAQAIAPDAIVFDPARCISCMRCVHVCPHGAIRCDCSALAARLKANFSAPRPVETFL